MRPRFSLRTLLIFTAFFAGFCYFWIVMPSVTAKHFVDAINAEDYVAADMFFAKSDGVSFILTNNNTFGFRTKASLLPWTIGEFCSGRRGVQIINEYMAFDEHVNEVQHVVATPFGLMRPTRTSSTSSVMVDRDQRISMRR